MSTTHVKPPNDIQRYHVVWCSESGLNSGSAIDSGELQGATISTSTWTLDNGITQISADTDAVTYGTVSYDANTVATIRIAEGIAGQDYEALNRITTSDGRTLDKTILIQVRGLASSSPWPITVGTYIIGGAYTVS
jgi:hypothetical protein